MKFLKNAKKVYKYSYGYRKYIILYLILSIIISITGVIIPYYTSLQLVNLTNGIWNKLIIYTVFIFSIRIFNSIIRFIIGTISQKFSKKVVSKIQIALSEEILKIKLTSIDNHSNGVFIQRITSDAKGIISVFTFGTSYFTSIIQDLGVMIIVFITNIWIGLLFVIYLIISIIIERLRIKIIDKKDSEYRDQNETTSGFTTEVIRGIRDIKMLNAEESFISKVKESIITLSEKSYDISYIFRLFGMISSILKEFFDLILILMIVYFIKEGYFEIAIGIAIYNYRTYITSLIYDLNTILDYTREFNMSCDRVFALFENEEFEKETFGTKHLEKVEGNFEFKNVEFSYGNKKVLNNLSFKVNANETVGFVGKSGVGKTTIFNLLCKMYDVKKGKITIDGIDINKLDKDSIRGNITIINQNPYIFNMSIRDNLKLVKKDLTEEEMINACKLACLDDYIENLEDKYDTIIGEGGVTLSGGQRQRLAIARALIQKTEIILFDEATSALDNETQAKIQKSIENMKSDYTILIIAHRLSTIVGCDRILFIDEGKVIAEGTHEQLLKNNQKYKELYESEIIEK